MARSRGRRAAGRADPTPLVPGRRRRVAVRLAGKSAGEISEIAPSIFVRTRSTAPEHQAHIIATFKTIGSLIAASVW